MKPVLVGIAAAAALLILGSVLSTAPSTVETLQADAVYGAYTTEMPNNNPTSLGFNSYSYLNSQQQPSWQQRYNMQMAQRAHRVEDLEQSDEENMQNQENRIAAAATVAIRKDIELAKLRAMRRQTQARKDGYFDAEKAHRHLAARKEGGDAAMISPEAAKLIFQKRQAQLRLQRSKELRRTFWQLARAVGSAPTENQPRQQRLQRNQRYGGDSLRGEEARLRASRKSMLAMESDVGDDATAGSDATSDVDDGDMHAHDALDDVDEPPSGSSASAIRSSSSSSSSSSSAPAESNAIPNDEDVHEMAADDVGDVDLGPNDPSNQGDNVFSSSPQQASLKQVQRSQLLAQIRSSTQSHRSQSLAAVAKEMGEEADDVGSQWHSFTNQLGMKPVAPNVDSRASRRVNELIDDDLM